MAKRSQPKQTGLEAALRLLKGSLWLAIKQGEIREKFSWAETIEVDGHEPYIVLLNVGQIGEEKKAA